MRAIKALFATLFFALCATPAPAAMAIVQHVGGIHASSIPGTVTLGGAPTAGNLIIELIGCNIASASITINTANWTQFDQAQEPSGNTVVMTALYRYVQGGDTATLPAAWTAGGTYWTHQVWEVSGVSGTWNTDFLSSVPWYGAISNTAIPQFPIFASGMALSGVASYNGNTNPSISGAWTLDDANNNNSNFGSEGGAHRVISSSDTIDGTWTQGSSAPFGGVFVLLTSKQPLGGVYPRHVYRKAVGSGFPAGITVPWVPKVGSLLLAYFDWGDGAQTNPTIVGANWTDWRDVTITTKAQLGLYRYVQGGDTAAIPAIASAGTGDGWAVTFVELGGASGVFSTDRVSDKSAGQASGATLTTTADTTTAVNQFALLSYGNYSGSALASTTGFTNYAIDEASNALYGSWFVAFKFFPNSGSTVQGVTTPNNSSAAQSYVQSIFNQGTATGRGTSGGYFHAFP